MKEIEKWTEVTKGLYHFVIGANICYEIHVIYWNKSTDILESNCSLFLVGDWFSRENGNTLERECLLEEKTMNECIDKAIKDNEENNV